jgi:quercetin dioxygenase-like cupin family protein
MQTGSLLLRVAVFAALISPLPAAAQTNPPATLAPPTVTVEPSEKPVTPPNGMRVLMENERVRMIEFHIKPRAKMNVEAPPNRERFLYMLTDGALVLAPPGRAPYEFALHAGETVLFPAVSPTVENDSDQPVRALMIELKQGTRTATSEPRGKRRHAKGTKRGKPKAGKTTRGKPTKGRRRR